MKSWVTAAIILIWAEITPGFAGTSGRITNSSTIAPVLSVDGAPDAISRPPAHDVSFPPGLQAPGGLSADFAGIVPTFTPQVNSGYSPQMLKTWTANQLLRYFGGTIDLGSLGTISGTSQGYSPGIDAIPFVMEDQSVGSLTGVTIDKLPQVIAKKFNIPLPGSAAAAVWDPKNISVEQSTITADEVSALEDEIFQMTYGSKHPGVPFDPFCIARVLATGDDRLWGRGLAGCGAFTFDPSVRQKVVSLILQARDVLPPAPEAAPPADENAPSEAAVEERVRNVMQAVCECGPITRPLVPDDYAYARAFFLAPFSERDPGLVAKLDAVIAGAKDDIYRATFGTGGYLGPFNPDGIRNVLAGNDQPYWGKGLPGVGAFTGGSRDGAAKLVDVILGPVPTGFDWTGKKL